jgi:hypothetical protein
MMKRETFAIATIYVPVKRRTMLDSKKVQEIVSGAAGRRPFRSSGRAASFGSMQATRRGNHRRVYRAGPPALTGWKRYRCMAALVPVPRQTERQQHRRGDRTGAKEISSGGRGFGFDIANPIHWFW